MGVNAQHAQTWNPTCSEQFWARRWRWGVQRHVEQPWGLNRSGKGLRNSAGSMAQRNCSHPNEQTDLNTASLQTLRPVLLSHGTVSNIFTHTGGDWVTKLWPNTQLVAEVKVGGLFWAMGTNIPFWLHIHGVITSICLCNLLWKRISRRKMMETFQTREPSEWCIYREATGLNSYRKASSTVLSGRRGATRLKMLLKSSSFKKPRPVESSNPEQELTRLIF